jgi:TRAP-type C4-dicarboxylate transport system substrate-binding protein
MYRPTIYGAMAAIFAGSAAFAQTELIYNSYLPPFNETYQVGIRDFAAAVNEKGGDLTITIPDSSLAPANRQYEMVRDGIADMAVVSAASVAQFVDLNVLAELPGFAPNSEIGSNALWETYKAHFEPVGELPGVKVLSAHVLPGRDILSVGDLTIDSVDDLQGKRMWATARSFIETTQALGGVPIDTEFSELQEYVARGDLDALFISPGSADGAGVLENVTQITRLPGGFGSVSFMVIISEDRWNELSESQQATLLEVAEGLPGRIGAASDASEAEVAEAVAQIPMNELSGDALASFEAVLNPQVDAWLASAKEAGLADPQAALDFYRSVLARESGN